MLQVEDLAVSYGPYQAVKGISLSVGEGEVVALIGANGAGKTTTLLGILGVLKKRGRVTFCGADITGWAPHRVVEHGLVLVPEGRRIVGTLTVQENLEMGAYRRRDRRWRSDLNSLCERFPVLGQRRNQMASSLSGGEQQMLAIARALISRPKMMLLDEPSMGLAPKIVDEVFRIIQEINAEGTAILLVEQNAHRSLEVANRAYVMEQGRIVHAGEARELARDHRIVEAYLT